MQIDIPHVSFNLPFLSSSSEDHSTLGLIAISTLGLVLPSDGVNCYLNSIISVILLTVEITS